MVLQAILSRGAYHAFPDTAPRDGERAREAGEEEISVDAAAMAYLMRGVHF